MIETPIIDTNPIEQYPGSDLEVLTWVRIFYYCRWPEVGKPHGPTTLN